MCQMSALPASSYLCVTYESQFPIPKCLLLVAEWRKEWYRPHKLL